MPLFTVIGVYSDPLGQRYASTVEADTPEKAELVAIAECAEDNGLDMEDRDEDDTNPAGLLIAGVVAGEVALLDMYTDGYTVGVPSRERSSNATS